MEFVDWRTKNATAGLPKFESICKDKLQGHSLSEDQWEAMKSWVKTEAQAGRYWEIMGNSEVCSPGFTLTVSAVDKEVARETVIMDASIGLQSQPERYRVTAATVEPISSDEWNEKYEDQRMRLPEVEEYRKSFPRPMEALGKLRDQSDGSQSIGSDGLYFSIGIIRAPISMSKSD
jgi:hypothetical protein